MYPSIYLRPGDLADAMALIADFGEAAGLAAAERAEASRNLGNHIHFCRWRQIERLIILLAVPAPVGTLH